MKTLIKVLVAVYLTISGAIGYVIYTGYRMAEVVPLTGQMKKWFDDYKGKTVKLGLYVVLTWPYYLIKNLISYHKVQKQWNDAMANDDVKKAVSEMCDKVDIAYEEYKNPKKDEKKEESEETNEDVKKNLGW